MIMVGTTLIDFWAERVLPCAKHIMWILHSVPLNYIDISVIVVCNSTYSTESSCDKRCRLPPRCWSNCVLLIFGQKVLEFVEVWDSIPVALCDAVDMVLNAARTCRMTSSTSLVFVWMAESWWVYYVWYVDKAGSYHHSNLHQTFLQMTLRFPSSGRS